jgi:hypothetical protein
VIKCVKCVFECLNLVKGGNRMNMADRKQYQLGNIETSEYLVKDLYIDLRRKVNEWAGITKQTSSGSYGLYRPAFS